MAITIRLLVANLMLPIATLCFAAGFFRYKPSAPVHDVELISYGDVSQSAPFDKVVFMVVDALRSDFVYSNKSGFQFTQSLIRSGAAIPFTAHAAAPSLTITRIKAMTEGSNPSFVDMFMNLADDETLHSVSVQDSWLARLKASRPDEKMLFYGENTWLQLYPDVFDRMEGVHAFYVPDFTLVDDNVTRHVAPELRSQDWSTLVLHFPGLDHVGHVGGPESAYMLPKQQEMDNMVQQIFRAMETQPHLQSTLFVVGGDHGMNAKGNHGGSSPGETSAALMFISPMLKKLGQGRQCPTTPHTGDFAFYSLVDQSDIVPSLSGLLGFTLPSHSLGVFIRELLPLWTEPLDHIRILRANAAHLMNIYRSKNDTAVDSNSTSSLGNLWEEIQSVHAMTDMRGEDRLRQLYNFCTRAQEMMGTPDGNLSLSLLLGGMFGASIAVLLSLPAPTSFSGSVTDARGATELFVISGTYALAIFATKLVEDEHRFWYYISPAWLAYIAWSKSTRENGNIVKSVSPLVLQLVAQSWNRSSDTELFTAAAHNHLPLLCMGVMIASAYLVIACLLFTHIMSEWGKRLVCPSAISLAFACLVFKLTSTVRHSPELMASFASPTFQGLLARVDSVLVARLLFAVFASTMIYLLFPSRRMKQIDTLTALLSTIGLYLMNQSRPINVPMFLIFTLQLDLLLCTTKLSPIESAVTAISLAHTSFFSLGGTNSIASIDIPLGYNGIRTWSAVGVPSQVIATNWSGPIWWSCGGLLLVFASTCPTGEPRSRDQGVVGLASSAVQMVDSIQVKPASNGTHTRTSFKHGYYHDYMAALSFSVSLGLVSLMAACLKLHLRGDPDLWISMAPAYALAGVWTVFLHPLVNATFCTAVWYLHV